LSPYDYSLPSPESSENIDHSPISSSDTSYSNYDLPDSEDIPKDQGFNFRSYNDWMAWDDLVCNALSPEQSFFPELKTEPLSPEMNSLDHLSETRYTLSPINETVDNMFREDPTQGPLFQTPSQPQEQLYSTPLAWSQPTPGTRRPYTTRLSAEEESHLRAIAMPRLAPSQTQPQSLSRQNSNKTQNQPQYPNSPSTTPSSPSPHPHFRKRKSSISSLSSNEDELPSHGKQPSTRHLAPKKIAHNMIEKRYRTNLNDKIATLRDSVPSLRVVGANTEDVLGEDLEGLTPAHKLNKATVLSKATEYIAHLEKRNKSLSKENGGLRSRVEAFEILMMARGEMDDNSGLRINGNGNRRRGGER